MNAREVALQTVRDVFPQAGSGPERSAQEALDYRARKADLSARDRAFATELAYGAIKMRRALDWYLHPFIGDRAQQLPPVIREILRLAVFELVYTKPDEHATVFEFVNLAKRHGHRGVANLVNGVLRSFLRERPHEPMREDFESDDDYLGTRYSLPTWIVRQWRATFGDRVEEICAGVNEPARTSITVNTLKTQPQEIAERFRDAGVHADVSPFVTESLALDDGGYARRNETSAAGAWWIQSESSAMPADVLNPQPEEAILDVCSGRGNKALQIGERLAGDGSMLCIELDERKAATLQQRLEQAGVPAGVIVGDATTELLRPEQRFDRILIDAPCSGIGILGRHPEARWKKQPSDGERLSRTQRAILDRIAPAVHEGGALVYAVCSTDPRETIEVVEWLRRHHNFERGLIPARYESLLTDDGDVLVAPGIGGRDGFFIARLERR
ncbi:MAG: 16S rRNA (cytosine(967)-C(5))-methyltransferase RsmB [Candidatus Eremiobacteraeota bacterium]|nr:16S rRNA (cytosine(967)-C(5))-methyltransferase RsmB [Candidatus Eremiobacteraeota bacterium]